MMHYIHVFVAFIRSDNMTSKVIMSLRVSCLCISGVFFNYTFNMHPMYNFVCVQKAFCHVHVNASIIFLLPCNYTI